MWRVKFTGRCSFVHRCMCSVAACDVSPTAQILCLHRTGPPPPPLFPCARLSPALRSPINASSSRGCCSPSRGGPGRGAWADRDDELELIAAGALPSSLRRRRVRRPAPPLQVHTSPYTTNYAQYIIHVCPRLSTLKSIPLFRLIHASIYLRCARHACS